MHTPTPWMISRNTDLGLMWIDSFDAPSEGIADLYHRVGIDREEFVSKANSEANAAFIVLAVNAHGPLLEALRAAREYVVDERDMLLDSACPKVDGEPVIEDIDHYSRPLLERDDAMLAVIDAALAKATAQKEHA